MYACTYVYGYSVMYGYVHVCVYVCVCVHICMRTAEECCYNDIIATTAQKLLDVDEA